MNEPPHYRLPPQPPESSWQFVRDLQEPLHQPFTWARHAPRPGEIDVRAGVSLDCRFPDPAGLLDTACADFRRFLNMGGLPDHGPYRIVTRRMPVAVPETHRIEITRREVRLLAGDTEGIRRALIFLEDELLRGGGPFLRPGVRTRRPWVRTRISRCFFGPIKRPPKNRDELLDDVNYYPAEYLNRLAHDGVNALWLTVEWKDVVPSDLFPAAGRDAERRLAKLNRTIARCARYGIRLYAFCIEPAAVPPDSPGLARHPELAGHRTSGHVYFCTSTAAGRAYVERSTRRLFEAAPGLGGMIVISVGERPTHCYSGGAEDIHCPRCRRRRPSDVLADTLAAMERGMHAADPSAELISWPYSQYAVWGHALTIEAAGRVPPGVTLQHNFESGARARQLGRARVLGDYWLSFVGPSALYRACAQRAARRGTRMSAKLQVGCSHEVATVPFVPVPGNLHGKYGAMRRLGVSAAMYSWYFGSYPSLMTRAAGELAFTPFPRSERAFLERLAQRDWGRHARRVAAAWMWFQKGYRQFPYAAMAGYYGPFHDGPVWPLFLVPRDAPLAPTWQIKYGVSGDRYGEMICYTHTPEEYRILFARMDQAWRRGWRLLAPLRAAARGHPDRVLDLGVAEALGIQFESGRNILEFYLARDHLFRQPPSARRRTLARMRALVRRELALDRRLLLLAEADPRLGFHSEAEGYKYHPALIRWRMRQLRRLLSTEFPAVAARARRHTPLFPAFTGVRPAGIAYPCRRVACAPAMTGDLSGPPWNDLPRADCRFVMSPHADWVQPLDASEHRDRHTAWMACHNGRCLYVGIACREPDRSRPRLPVSRNGRLPYPYWGGDCAAVILEPRRLWPAQMFVANVEGARWQRWAARAGDGWTVSGRRTADGWSVIFRIPFRLLREAPELDRPMRLDVFRAVPQPDGLNGERLIRWMRCRSWPSRLAFRRDNPADLGWLVFGAGPARSPRSMP